MEWSMKIERVENGFVLDYIREDSELEAKAVFEFDYDKYEDETLAEMNALKDMYWFIRDYFGIYNDKHNGLFLNIDIEQEKDEEDTKSYIN